MRWTFSREATVWGWAPRPALPVRAGVFKDPRENLKVHRILRCTLRPPRAHKAPPISTTVPMPSRVTAASERRGTLRLRWTGRAFERSYDATDLKRDGAVAVEGDYPTAQPILRGAAHHSPAALELRGSVHAVVARDLAAPQDSQRGHGARGGALLGEAGGGQRG